MGEKPSTPLSLIKFENFKQITRSKTQTTLVGSDTTLHHLSQKLLSTCNFEGCKIRFISV